jgi:hypothetical protein
MATQIRVGVGAGTAFVNYFEGGNGMADVVTVPAAAWPPDKRVSQVRFTEMTWEPGFARAKPWAAWVNDFMHDQHTRVIGVVAFTDTAGVVNSYLDFTDALLAGVTIGALDSSKTDPVDVVFKVRPKTTRRRQSDGARLEDPSRTIAALRSNFRVAVGDLPTQRVRAVGPISWRMNVKEERRGDSKLVEIVPTHVESSPLTLTMPAADAVPWQSWFDNSTSGNVAGEVPGTIEYLAPNLRDVVASIRLDRIGISAVEHDKVDTAGASTRLCRVSMYFENSTLTINSIDDGVAQPAGS